VEHAVRTAGGAGVEPRVAFEQPHVDAPHREVPSDADASHPAADHDGLRLDGHRRESEGPKLERSRSDRKSRPVRAASGRMHVHVNAAESVDGKLSTRQREQVAISGSEDFDRMDELRAESDGVLVGVGTVLADDPGLTVKDSERREQRKEAGKPPNPVRVVADSHARTPPDAKVLDDAAETYVLVSEAADECDTAALSADDVTVVVAGAERVDLETAFTRLENHGIETLMVEGGGELIFSLFEADLVDRLTVYVGSVVIGGRQAPTLADGEGFTDPDAFSELSLVDVEQLDDGVVLYYDA